MKNTKKFIGREKELKTLEDLSADRTASLAVIRGRRRVGKSALVKEFAEARYYFDGPYIQRPTSRKRACQIDYLIQTRLGVFYVCEIKLTTKTLGVSVIDEVKEKIKALKNPKNTSLVPILIYLGDRSEDLENSDYFIREINAGVWFD